MNTALTKALLLNASLGFLREMIPAKVEESETVRTPFRYQRYKCTRVSNATRRRSDERSRFGFVVLWF